MYVYAFYTVFSVNSEVMIIMSSGDYIVTIYDMGIIKHHFST